MKEPKKILIFLILFTIPFIKFNLSAQDKESASEKTKADFVLYGHQNQESFFVDSNSYGEISPIGRNKKEGAKVLDPAKTGVHIYKTSDSNLVRSIRNGTKTKNTSTGSQLTPVFRNSIDGQPFLLSGGIEIVFSLSAQVARIEYWLAEKGVRGQAIFPGSKVYIIESDSGFAALELANLLAKDSFPESVSPLKSRQMEKK